MVKRRKEDRQTRKKTKYGLESDQLKSGGNVVSKQSSNASIVFSKNSYASLVVRGKARQQQLKQQQQHAGSGSMDVNSEPISLSTGIKYMAGKAALQTSFDHGLVQDLPLSNAPTQELDPTLSGKRDSSIKAYMKELRKVMDNADVLLEVIDARDPLGCRSLETETMLMRAGKKVVLILNKIDLVPKANVEAWLKYLRHDFPTLAFKASTQSQRTNLSQGASSVFSRGGKSNSSSSNDASMIQGGSEAIGAGALLQLIKNYSRNLNMKTSIVVGVFGAPNVGKSSVINSLKRARVCSVASTPGHTKVVQSVMLDKSVRLLDCPGIVFSDESAAGAQALGLSPAEILQRRQSALLRNVVKVELVQDPITPVEAIMARVEPEQLCQIYGLDFFQPNDAQDLLMRIAINRGRLARGGKIDIEGTARSVLHDWNIGRINYYTQPPALHRSAILSSAGQTDIPSDQAPAAALSVAPVQTSLEQSTAIVPQFSEAFDLAALLGEADAEVFGVDEIPGGSGYSVGLTDAPSPRFAEAEAESDVENIVDDHVPVEPQGDSSRQSTLGKRTRGFDSDSDSDDDMSEQEQENLVDEEERDVSLQQSQEVNSPPQADFAFKSSALASGPGKRASELGSAFSTSELSHMAVPTSIQRQRLKKLKKRAQRSTAGLAGMFEHEAALGDANDSENVLSQGGRGVTGMFGSLSQPAANKTAKSSSSTKARSKVPTKTGSMFDVLMMAQDEEDEDVSPNKKVAQSRAETANVVHTEEFEEEL